MRFSTSRLNSRLNPELVVNHQMLRNVAVRQLGHCRGLQPRLELGGRSAPLAMLFRRFWRMAGTGPKFVKVQGRIFYYRNVFDQFLGAS